jgi:DNA-binding transcriptional LysR family regulator
VNVRKAIYVQLTEAVIEMVKANIGIAVLPKWTIKTLPHKWKSHQEENK